MTPKSREQRARRVAIKQGLTLVKSRARVVHADDAGGYMLVDANSYIEAGETFDLDIDAVEAALGMQAQGKAS